MTDSLPPYGLGATSLIPRHLHLRTKSRYYQSCNRWKFRTSSLVEARTAALFWQQIELGAHGIINEVFYDDLYAHMWFALFNPMVLGPCDPKPRPSWLKPDWRGNDRYIIKPVFMAVQ